MTSKKVQNYKILEEFPIGIFSQTSYITDIHHHAEYEIFFLEKGKADVCIDDFEAILKPGDAVFMYPGTDHYIRKLKNNQDFKYIAICFDTRALGPDGDTIRTIFDNIRVSKFISLPDEIIEKIKNATHQELLNSFGCKFLTKSVLFEIIAHIIQTRQYVEVKSQSFAGDKHNVNAINTTLSYIKEHYRETITMQDILQITLYSKSHFIRLFKKYTGMNLTQYINKYRVEQACLELLYTNKNITEIATENGFNNLQYFSKIFKDYMNCTPKKYQRTGKNIITPSAFNTYNQG